MGDELPVAATIGAVGSVASAGIGYLGATSAADKQAQAAQNALDFQQSVYNQNQNNFKPYLSTGSAATYSLGQLYGFPDASGNATQKPDYSAFYNSPDYQFAQQQGQNATQNVLSAQGNLLSGSGLAALNTFGQGLASQQYGNYFNRLLSLSNMGQQSAGALANTSTQAANNIGNTYQGIGQAQASGIVGGTNAITGGIGGATSALQLPALANYLKTSGASAPGGVNPSSYGPINTYGAAGPDFAVPTFPG